MAGKNGGTLIRLEPGESGNPAGRPPGSRNRSTIARKWLEAQEKVKNPITGQQEQLSEEDIMTLALIKKARSGDTSAYKALMDSAYGLPKQDVNLGGELSVRTVRMVKDYGNEPDPEADAGH
ncbi:DUF5681 domain-containing protein [Larkinella soli]|uniref:DUF5681 domain-containing protein n=1 Tax=Larkinella soli TaxID=1770527 RepID=UPI001E42769C|nr:DUF5681 domain-containing protein [Larkinella soli]